MVLPEVETDVDEVASIMRGAHEEGKDHALVVVAEGAQYNAEAMARHFKEYEDELGFKLRVVTLGHVQRGGHRGTASPQKASSELWPANSAWWRRGRASWT